MQTSQTVSITRTVASTDDIMTECISDVDEGLDTTNILDSQCSGDLTFELADATAEVKLAREHESMIGADNEEKGPTRPLPVRREQQPVSRANGQLRVAIIKTIIISKTT